MTEPSKKPRPIKRIEIAKDGWPRFGLLRCDQIIAPGGILPMSHSQFWVLVKQRQIPVVHLSPRVSGFWVHDLRRIFFGDEVALQLAESSACDTDQSASAEPAPLIVEPSSANTPPDKPIPPISKATVNSDGRRPVTTPAD